MVGDSLPDVEFGRRLGMLTVFIDGAPEHQKPGAREAREIANLRFNSLEDAVMALLNNR
jgi:FMN phosphatase YigB (HAD superfamily)